MGFEPITTWSQTKHSTKLNYYPILAEDNGLEPLHSESKSDALPLS